MSDRIPATFERIRPAISHLSQRKVLLAYTAFARRFEPLAPGVQLDELLLTAERVADDELDLRCLSEADKKTFRLMQPEMGWGPRHAAWIACELGFYTRSRCGELIGRPSRSGKTAAESMFETMLYWLQLLRWEQVSPEQDWFEQEIQALVDILRDVGGTAPAGFDLRWVTDETARLARQMYDTRDFAAMPILADALQDAGCEHADILAHCRGDGPHVRGCWVVDLVLGLM